MLSADQLFYFVLNGCSFHQGYIAYSAIMNSEVVVKLNVFPGGTSQIFITLWDLRLLLL